MMDEALDSLEEKHMLSYGTILAMDAMLTALIAIHPEKAKVLEFLEQYEPLAVSTLEQQVMMTDFPSPHVITAHNQFIRMLVSYKNRLQA